MKKIGFVISALVSAFVVGATGADYEITPVVGDVWPEGNLNLKTEGTVGGEFQFNNIFETIKPEFSILVSPDASYQKRYKTIITRFLFNGVHEYDALGSAVPFMKAGIGYENISFEKSDNTDSVMVDAGVGLKFPILKNVALKLEAIYMLKYNDARWDNNLAGLGGVTFAFGGTESTRVENETGVLAAVVADSDGDGVADAEDKCPETPGGFKVDRNGCPLQKTIRVTFESGSKTLAASSQAEVAAFATFLKESPAYSVEIVGHTDSTGSEKGNMALSKARAESVKAMLVDNGVDAKRIVTIGKGESEPIAGNDTAEGRAMNRRIEVILHK